MRMRLAASKESNLRATNNTRNADDDISATQSDFQTDHHLHFLNDVRSQVLYLSSFASSIIPSPGKRISRLPTRPSSAPLLSGPKLIHDLDNNGSSLDKAFRTDVPVAHPRPASASVQFSQHAGNVEGIDKNGRPVQEKEDIIEQAKLLAQNDKRILATRSLNPNGAGWQCRMERAQAALRMERSHTALQQQEEHILLLTKQLSEQEELRSNFERSSAEEILRLNTKVQQLQISNDEFSRKIQAAFQSDLLRRFEEEKEVVSLRELVTKQKMDLQSKTELHEAQISHQKQLYDELHTHYEELKKVKEESAKMAEQSQENLRDRSRKKRRQCIIKFLIPMLSSEAVSEAFLQWKLQTYIEMCDRKEVQLKRERQIAAEEKDHIQKMHQQQASNVDRILEEKNRLLQEYEKLKHQSPERQIQTTKDETAAQSELLKGQIKQAENEILQLKKKIALLEKHSHEKSKELITIARSLHSLLHSIREASLQITGMRQRTEENAFGLTESVQSRDSNENILPKLYSLLRNNHVVALMDDLADSLLDNLRNSVIETEIQSFVKDAQDRSCDQDLASMAGKLSLSGQWGLLCRFVKFRQMAELSGSILSKEQSDETLLSILLKLILTPNVNIIIPNLSLDDKTTTSPGTQDQNYSSGGEFCDDEESAQNDVQAENISLNRTNPKESDVATAVPNSFDAERGESLVPPDITSGHEPLQSEMVVSNSNVELSQSSLEYVTLKGRHEKDQTPSSQFSNEGHEQLESNAAVANSDSTCQEQELLVEDSNASDEGHELNLSPASSPLNDAADAELAPDSPSAVEAGNGGIEQEYNNIRVQVL